MPLMLWVCEPSFNRISIFYHLFRVFVFSHTQLDGGWQCREIDIERLGPGTKHKTKVEPWAKTFHYTQGTRGGSGFCDQMLAVKSRKNARKSLYKKIKKTPENQLP